MQKAQLKQIIKQVLREEFVEHTGNSSMPGKKYSWMKDVPLVFTELDMGSAPSDPENSTILKDYTYLEGPEDVAEVLFDLITEEDTAGTDYDFQTIKADYDAYYDFLNTTFDKLVHKYDEELLSAFEDRAVESAQREFDDYDPEDSPFFHIHENSGADMQLKEDNMADMRRHIRAEIAQLEAEKAADTDPYSAVYYDEKIKACWAELRELGIIAPTKATAKKRAIKAEQEEKAKEISRFLRYAFMGLSKYFGRPRCDTLKGGGLIIIFKKELTPAATAEAVDICEKAGIPIKNKENSGSRPVFEVDVSNLNIQGPFYRNNIDTEAIKTRLEAELASTTDSSETEINEQVNLEENSAMDTVKRFKKLLILLLIERKGSRMANRIYNCDIEIDDTLPTGSCTVSGNVIYIHSSLLADKFEDAAAKVIAAVANESMISAAKGVQSNTPKYIISMKRNPVATEKAFYSFDDGAFDFKLVDRAAATIYTSLGHARRNANDILSMSDYHRINILDADTLAEVDSLDYYNDYEDETDYPGYFDEDYNTKDLNESAKHISVANKMKLHEEFKLYENMWDSLNGTVDGSK